MPSFFESLGRSCGRVARKARWLGQELTGTEDEALEAEGRVGRDLAEALAAELPDGQKPAADAQVDACGSRLVACVRNRKRQFRFLVLPGPQLNALALPGGFIYVTQPLLTLCAAQEDDLAFVLAHEMAHVIRFHVKDRILGSSLLSLMIGAAPGSGALRQALRQMARQFLNSEYSQEQELEADAFGVKLVRHAGYEPAAGLRVLRLLQTQLGGAAEGRGYFSSHPPFATRVANLKQCLQGSVKAG